MSAIWTRRPFYVPYDELLVCSSCYWMRGPDALRLGHCDKDGQCTDVNGCRRRAAHFLTLISCSGRLNRLLCSKKDGHIEQGDPWHTFGNTRWNFSD